jgi:methionyl-tRNA formyltransferase
LNPIVRMRILNDDQPLRVVFMGSGPFALPALDALSSRHDVVAVVTQPDREIGRGRRMQRGLVAGRADDLRIPVLQPASFKEIEAVAAVEDLAPEVIVVASYGRILPRRVLDLAKRGALNLHPSLLPRHRGASPITWTILSGDDVTGVSVMEMVAKMDAGPIVGQRNVPVLPDDNTASLTDRLAPENASLLLDVLPAWYVGDLITRPQNESEATYTELLTKESGAIDWSLPARDLERRVRAFVPWPVAFGTWSGGPLRVFAARALPDSPMVGHLPGNVVDVTEDEIKVQTGEGILSLLEVQPPGSRRMSAGDFARGRPEIQGSHFSEPE